MLWITKTAYNLSCDNKKNDNIKLFILEQNYKVNATGFC